MPAVTTCLYGQDVNGPELVGYGGSGNDTLYLLNMTGNSGNDTFILDYHYEDDLFLGNDGAVVHNFTHGATTSLSRARIQAR